MRMLGLAFFGLLFLSACSVSMSIPPPAAAPASRVFDGKHAYQEYFLGQLKFGVRPAGSAALRATGDYIIAQLKTSQWKTETQEFTYRGVPVRNIIAKTGEGRGSLIIIGAHYDTRPRADRDRTNPNQPILGANDGASGVAVLLELARTLDTAKLKNEVWLAFFDAEDNGDLTSCHLIPSTSCDQTTWNYSIGAEYVAANLQTKPTAVVILDMIGDADQNIYYEQYSDPELSKELWNVAARLGYTRRFIPEPKWSITDDHVPFLQRGIRAVDIIDFDYPYWHTTQDTADKVSAESLESVGRVVKEWLESR